jgi:general secretion pathway protein A
MTTSAAAVPVTPAVASAAPPSAATAEPVAAPAKSVEAAVPRLRDILDNSEPLSVVTSHLIHLWSPNLTVPVGAQVCPSLASQGLQCYRAHGDWKELQMLNRPAILTLATGRGVLKYVLLRDFEGDDLMLDTAQGTLKMPRDDLATAWTGEFLVLWRPPTNQIRITSGTRGPAVVWLRQQLALGAGQTLQEPVSPLFDNVLREQLLRFQRERGIDADGVAGPRTQMLLSAISTDPAEPRLNPVALSSGDAAYRRASTP